MESVYTKNSIVDMDVFFYKPGYTNIKRPLLSLLKIDSAQKTTPVFHIGSDKNMGYVTGNRVYTGVMVFEVLEGYPLQSIMFTNNVKENKYFQQSLEDLEFTDFYCIQKKNKDPYGDFILKNIKFIDTKMTQSIEEYSRRLIATFVCSDKIPFRFPYMFNAFKSDRYSSHLIRSKQELEEICKDIQDSSFLKLNQIREYLKILSPRNNYGHAADLYGLEECLRYTYKEVAFDYIYRVPMNRQSAIYRVRDFIASFYHLRNQYKYSHAKDRGDLDFLKFLNIDEATRIVKNPRAELGIIKTKDGI